MSIAAATHVHETWSPLTNPYTLTFPDDLEAAFQNAYLYSNLQLDRLRATVLLLTSVILMVKRLPDALSPLDSGTGVRLPYCAITMLSSNVCILLWCELLSRSDDTRIKVLQRPFRILLRIFNSLAAPTLAYGGDGTRISCQWSRSIIFISAVYNPCVYPLLVPLSINDELVAAVFNLVGLIAHLRSPVGVCIRLLEYDAGVDNEHCTALKAFYNRMSEFVQPLTTLVPHQDVHGLPIRPCVLVNAMGLLVLSFLVLCLLHRWEVRSRVAFLRRQYPNRLLLGAGMQSWATFQLATVLTMAAVCTLATLYAGTVQT